MLVLASANDGCALLHAAAELRADRDVVMAATSQPLLCGCTPHHATSSGILRCLLKKHRRQMRVMYGFIDHINAEEEMDDWIIEHTGANIWLGHCPHMDEVVEDVEKLEMQECLAEACDTERFVMAIASRLKLQKVNVELDELRLENAELRRKVALLEDNQRFQNSVISGKVCHILMNLREIVLRSLSGNMRGRTAPEHKIQGSGCVVFLGMRYATVNQCIGLIK